MMIRPLLLALSALSGLVSMRAFAATKEPITVKIIGFNDHHGNLESPGSFGVNLVPIRALADRFGLSRPHAEARSPTGAAGVRADVDAVCERLLHCALQVLVAP